MLRPEPPLGAADLRVCRLSSIHEIPEALWDSLCLGGEQPYHAHRLIRAVEDARVANSRFWPLIFYDGERPVASAVISAFTVSLDLFLGRTLQKLAALVRNRFPSFLQIDVLFCGLPLSLAQCNLVISRFAPAQRVLELLAAEMETIAREAGLRFLCVKEFKASELSKVQGLEPLGFFCGHSIPNMMLQLSWRSFDDYLGSLRHPYRRHILRSLAKIGMQRPQVHAFSPNMDSDPHLRLVLGGPELISPGCFFQLYRNVMARAKTRLETLNQEFFERLWLELGDDLRILAAIGGGKVLGAALLLKTETTLHFMLVGLPEPRESPHDIYFNLVYAICDQAMRQGCRQLNLGQTAYWKKQQIGGEPEDVFLFFKAANPVLHAVLRALRRILFPRVQLKSVRVFK